jgi:hypothetical protein
MNEPVPDSSILIQCLECRNVFEFTQGEQEFFKLKGFHIPKRCPVCREKRRREK